MRREIHSQMHQSKTQLAKLCVTGLHNIGVRFGQLEYDETYIKKYRFLDLLSALSGVMFVLDKMENDVKEETAWMNQ